MAPIDAVQYLAAILIFTGLAVWRIPVRCSHNFECPRCKADAEQAKRDAIAAAHYWHLSKDPNCWKCDEDRPRR